jgi:hypothetical protein
MCYIIISMIMYIYLIYFGEYIKKVSQSIDMSILEIRVASGI